MTHESILNATDICDVSLAGTYSPTQFPAKQIPMGDFSSVSGYVRQVAPGVTGPTEFAVNKNSSERRK